MSTSGGGPLCCNAPDRLTLSPAGSSSSSSAAPWPRSVSVLFFKETSQPQQACHVGTVLLLFLASLLAMKPLEPRGEHQDSNGHKQTAVKGDILPRLFNLAQVLDGHGFAQRC